MAKRLVTLLSQKRDGELAYEEAIRNCCDRGGYDLVACVAVIDGNEPIVRIHEASGQVEHEATGYRNAAEMLLEHRTSPLSATANHLPRRPIRQPLSPLQQAGELVGAT